MFSDIELYLLPYITDATIALESPKLAQYNLFLFMYTKMAVLPESSVLIFDYNNCWLLSEKA